MLEQYHRFSGAIGGYDFGIRISQLDPARLPNVQCLHLRRRGDRPILEICILFRPRKNSSCPAWTNLPDPTKHLLFAEMDTFSRPSAPRVTWPCPRQYQTVLQWFLLAKFDHS